MPFSKSLSIKTGSTGESSLNPNLESFCLPPLLQLRNHVVIAHPMTSSTRKHGEFLGRSTPRFNMTGYYTPHSRISVRRYCCDAQSVRRHAALSGYHLSV